jgi:hypothetical protein
VLAAPVVEEVAPTDRLETTDGQNIRTSVKNVPERFSKLFLRLSTKPCG